MATASITVIFTTLLISSFLNVPYSFAFSSTRKASAPFNRLESFNDDCALRQKKGQGISGHPNPRRYRTSSSSSSGTIPSWDELESTPDLSRPLQTHRPIYKDFLPSEVEEENLKRSNPLPVLFRDADCICAASQMVWFAMECKNVEYLTVLVPKSEDSYLPKIVWPNENKGTDDTTDPETDPLKLLEQIQSHYPQIPPNFYPKLSISVDASRCNILRFPGVMPRNSDPNFMSSAPFLFRSDGTSVAKSSHCVSLEELEEMLEEYDDGPFLCGEFTAADMAWIPYLERYAVQLPMCYPKTDVLNPRSSSAYELVNEWYLALERIIPHYACSVQGDGKLWRKCLEEVVKLHNERLAEGEATVKLSPVPKRSGWWLKKNPNGEGLWEEYVKGRPWLGESPGKEVALFLARNREEIISKSTLAAEGADAALRELVHVLIDWKLDSPDADSSVDNLSENARQMAVLVNEMISIPRDMGMIPALALSSLCSSLKG